MFILYLILIGLLFFAVGVGVLGRWLRRHPSKDNAERSSRVMHFLILGIILAIPGLYFLAITNKLLRALGSGANAFRLTKRIVADDVYKRTRNPMSLGFYLWTLAVGLASGSTFITLTVLLGFIPAHIFFLKYFEELELELRFGESYREYKRTVPFLIPSFTSIYRMFYKPGG